MRKWKWLVAAAVLLAGVGIAVGMMQLRDAAEAMAEAQLLLNRWGMYVDASSPEALEQAMWTYQEQWKQRYTIVCPFENTPESWCRESEEGRHLISASVGSWSAEWSPLFPINHVAKARVRSDFVWVERREDGSYHITACVARDELRASMVRENGSWKVSRWDNSGDAWMMERYVLSGAQDAAELLTAWGPKMNAAQKSALQNAAALTEQPYESLDAAIQAANEIQINAFCPLRP